MKKCKEATTPMATSIYLDLDEKGKLVDESHLTAPMVLSYI